MRSYESKDFKETVKLALDLLNFEAELFPGFHRRFYGLNQHLLLGKYLKNEDKPYFERGFANISPDDVTPTADGMIQIKLKPYYKNRQKRPGLTHLENFLYRYIVHIPMADLLAFKECAILLREGRATDESIKEILDKASSAPQSSVMSFGSSEMKEERTAHYFDLDRTLTKTKYQYDEHKRDENEISRNIKPELAVTFRHLLINNSVLAIITRGNEYRAKDVLRAVGLTENEISRIRIFAEGKDDGSKLDDNFKKNAVRQLIVENESIHKHFFYDDDAEECCTVESLIPAFSSKAITTYQVTRDPETIDHFNFARTISSNPDRRMKIDNSKPLCNDNDATNPTNAITKNELHEILGQYKTTSYWAKCCSLFSTDRSKFIKELRKLSEKDCITKNEIEKAIKLDSQRRLTLFTNRIGAMKNGTSTDDLVYKLALRFSK